MRSLLVQNRARALQSFRVPSSTAGAVTVRSYSLSTLENVTERSFQSEVDLQREV